MQHLEQVKTILSDTLGMDTGRLDENSALMGSVAELDSMAVIGLITALEQHYGFEVADDEISARHFATLGSLSAFVHEKLAQ